MDENLQELDENREGKEAQCHQEIGCKIKHVDQVSPRSSDSVNRQFAPAKWCTLKACSKRTCLPDAAECHAAFVTHFHLQTKELSLLFCDSSHLDCFLAQLSSLLDF
jgi:hypothetical protein